TFEPFHARATRKDGGSPATSGLPLALQTHAQCVRLASILTLAKTVTVTDIRKAIFQGLQENAKVSVFGLIPVPYPPHSRLGIGPDGKPLPQPNKKRIHPRMYPVLVVNQDGSTYTMRHRTPLRILALPLDPATLTPEEREERERARRAARERVYVEEDVEEDDWDQDHYRRLIDR
ncbi:39S ribosomal protein L55, mitochondrial, partial [Geodia barretti]